MKSTKTINVISILVIIFAVICCIVPFITNNELTDKTSISVFGETISLYGKGIYARNSFSGAIQAIAQDFVTLFIVVPSIV